MPSKYSINYYLILSIIFTLPYMNFPYIEGGTIKPLSLVPLSIYLALNIGRLIKKKSFFYFLILFILVILYDLLLTLNIDDIYLNSKPLRNQYIGFFQLIILGFFTYIAYYIGRYEIKKYFSKKKILFYIILAYYPSLIFGFVHTLSVNFGYSNPIFFLRELVASTIFPDNYYRNMMLTTEPSFAASDLMVILIPLIFLYKKNNSIFFYITITLIGVNFIGAKSGLGFVLLIMTFSYILIKANIKYLFFYAIPIVTTSSLLLFYFNSNLVNRVYKINNTLTSNDTQVEESAATRIVSYKIALKIFHDHPLGIGYSNEGFFYSKYLKDDLLIFYLFSDWVAPSSKRFADIKSTILKIVTSFGIVGLLFLLYIMYNYFLIIKNRNLKGELLLIYNIFIITMIGMSFSISLVGYLSILLVLGYLTSLVQEQNNLINCI